MLNSIRKFLSPPVFADEEKTRSAYYINAIVLINIPVLVLFFLARIAQGNAPFGLPNMILLSLVAVLTIVLILTRFGAVRLAGYVHISMIWVASTLLALNGSGVRGTGFISYFVVMLLAGLLLGVRTAVGIAILSILSGFGLAYAETIGVITYTPGPAFGIATEATVLFIFSTIFMVLTINSLQNALKRARANANDLEISNRELTGLRDALELRVQERTSALEKRATQLETVSNVARAVTSVQDINTLLPDITRLVSDRFGFYHVGIFLLDDANEFAVFRASNSEGGARMLDRQHKLKLDSNSIVGFATSHNEPRIALDVGADSVYFNNPDLPNTRSEIALPLRISGRVIGALDVQSVQPNAFSEEDVATLTILADQVAIAIENARLFSESSAALTETEKTFERYIKREWGTFASQAKSTGYLFDGNHTVSIKPKGQQEKVKALAQTGRLSLEKESSEITIPIKLRGQTVGFLEVNSKKGRRQWTRDEITLLESAAERAALALENARLVETAQRRATRERAIGEISSRIGAVTDVNAIMQMAVEELGRKISGAMEVTIELGEAGEQAHS
jgi:GAF domain-containing protein